MWLAQWMNNIAKCWNFEVSNRINFRKYLEYVTSSQGYAYVVDGRGLLVHLYFVNSRYNLFNLFS